MVYYLAKINTTSQAGKCIHKITLQVPHAHFYFLIVIGSAISCSPRVIFVIKKVGTAELLTRD